MNKFKIKVKKDGKYLVTTIEDRLVKDLKSDDEKFSKKFQAFATLIIKNENKKSTEFVDIKGDRRIREKRTYIKLPYPRFKSYFIQQLRILGYEVQEM
ncbi:hypothetical protein JW766_02290 [Candidatus Dojkabacteria bacterium]|nr:hypothetical protein [Candidatus Dojkabacteria bacterium]